jgi:RimJ/RimL family protein N-acetyltransferase
LLAYQTLRLEALRHHQDAFMADYEQQAARSIEYWQESLFRNINSPSGVIYFAVVDQSLVAMMGIGRVVLPKQQHSANIWGVYIRPDWRGFRIADDLVAHGLDWARSQQIRVVKLGVMATNVGAVRCYLRCGFSVYGVEPEAILVDGVYHDELLMIRRLM